MTDDDEGGNADDDLMSAGDASFYQPLSYFSLIGRLLCLDHCKLFLQRHSV